MSRQRVWLISLVMLCGAVSLPGQTPSLDPGTRVRLRFGHRTIEGTIATMTADSIAVFPPRQPAEPLVVAWSDVQEAARWRGRGSRWKGGAELGSFFGFAGVSLAYGYRMRDCSRHHCPNVIQWSAAVGFSSLVGGIVGGLIGATVKHDQWQRLSLAAVRPHVAVRGGQTQLGLAVRF